MPTREEIVDDLDVANRAARNPSYRIRTCRMTRSVSALSFRTIRRRLAMDSVVPNRKRHRSSAGVSADRKAPGGFTNMSRTALYCAGKPHDCKPDILRLHYA
jgi:hypothetical protein